MEEIPVDFLEDIVKVFLLGIDKELKDEYGDTVPNIIARPYRESKFEYIVRWDVLIDLRHDVVRVLKNSENKKLNLLAMAIELIHEDDQPHPKSDP